MTLINKQKFVAELSSLLPFMYEEDRQLALGMYEQMFDSCSDTQGLMQVLVSPTRQAVKIARSYNANERKLQIRSESREGAGVDAEGASADFVLAINDIFQTLSAKHLLDEEESGPVVLENQISIFDEDVEEEEELPAAQEDEENTDIPVSEAEGTPEESPVAELCEEAAAEESAEQKESDPADIVDAFLADFSIDEKELVPENAECEQPAEVPEEEAAEEETESESEAETEAEPETEAKEEIVPVQTSIETEEAVSEETPAVSTVRKPRVFLMILYTLFAIPFTLVGLALLLVPTLLVLALSCAVILAGSAVFAAAFGGFAVFADLLVVLGSSLVVLAVGLILLWLFIWFVGGAIVGFIKGIVRLGSRCCYKEVAA